MSSEPERRDEAREPIDLKVEYKRLNAFFYDYTKNISKGGTFIKTARPLPVGTLFVFRLVVPGLAQPLVFRGEVRSVGAADTEPHKAPASADSGMGIRFIYENEEERLAVHDTVEHLMRDSLGPLISAQLRSG